MEMVIIPFEEKTPRLHEDVFIAQGAQIIGDVHIDAGSSIWFGAIVRGDIHSIRIGKDTNLQDGAVVHVTAEKWPVKIGDRVSIGHRAMIHGCTIGDDCLIAMNATILDGATIGEHCLIAAGALVTEGMQVPPRSVVMGVPGKVVRTLRPEESERIRLNWEHYKAYVARWKASNTKHSITF